VTVFGLKLGYQVRGQDDELALQKMQVAFERMGEGMENFGEVFFPKLTLILEDEVEGQFKAEGKGPNRGNWKDLSPAYEAQKLKKYPGTPKLVATGTMKEALTQSSSANALRQEGGNSFNFGTSGVPYASLHQTGTSKMPDRPPFDFGADFEKKVQHGAAEAAREIATSTGVTDFAEWKD